MIFSVNWNFKYHIFLVQQLKEGYEQNQTPYQLLLTTLILIVCEKSVPPWPIKFSSVLTVGFEVIRKQENPLASASRLLGD